MLIGPFHIQQDVEILLKLFYHIRQLHSFLFPPYHQATLKVDIRILEINTNYRS